MMSSDLSMEQMPETPVIEESREPDNRQSKQSKNMPRVHTASSLVLQSEEPKKLRNDSGAQRYWSPHDLEVFKKPLCLISAGPRNELKLEVDTIEQLSKIDLPCVVVAIAGLYRTGKSFLMNRLADQNRGFALGDSIKSTTKGIWVWCRVHPEQKNTVLVLLDTEGLGDIAEGDPTHDNTLFTLATLLSSTLVYNMKGAFDQDAVNKLTFVTELSKNIALENRFDDALQCILPGFVLVVRDFTLKLVKGDRKITADEYLEESLQDVDYGKSSKNEKFNRARASIRNYFPESRRKCFLLPPPGDLDITENLEMLRFEDLSRRFQEQTTCFVSYINAQPPKKLVVSKPVTGSMFAELTRTYVEAIRNGGVPDVEDAFAAVAKSENEKVKKETLDKFEVFMSKCTVPAPIKQLEPQYREAELASLVHFRTNAVFDDGNIVEKEVQYMGAWSEFLQSIKSKEAFIMSKDESLSEEESLEEKQKQEEKLQAMANRMKEDAANALRNQQDSFRNQQEVINKERERERVAREAELRRFMEDRNVVLEKLLKVL
ncbi:GBP2-like protein [Mya arenaria]|uniref:GBP2-like protein n=1 Tax=Mya arenaria TaxID=6604 RepID=A0ABY7G777_MYAAR|nr:GBP2-like protein [Mya arenaria]